MMSTNRIVYASVCQLPAALAATEIAGLVSKARDRNTSLGVTGALIYSEKHFAQLLEGDAASLDCLMTSILRDPRHKDLVVLENAQVPVRRFGAWSLGYFGPSIFVNTIIKRSIYEAGRASHRGLVELTRLMEELATGGAGQSIVGR